MLAPNALRGHVIDNRYRLQAFLGNGASGYVFAADEVVMGETVGQVAVKLIRPQDDSQREAVLAEIRAMAGLSHPHLLSYRSSGEYLLPSGESLIFLAIELADTTLEDRMAHGSLSPVQVSEMAGQIAGALVYLQERNVVHRDLKPANILCVTGTWKIADFGLSRSLTQPLKKTVNAAGTPLYMSPDAIDGDIAAPGDVWALGAIVQECLSGSLPYPDLAGWHFPQYVAANEPFIAPGLPHPFEGIVRGCLVKNPAARWTAKQVRDALHTPPLQPPTVLLTPVPAPAPPPAASAYSTTQLPAPTQVLKRADDEPVIDATGNGSYRSINQALAASPASKRFWIRPGLYREEVVLDRPLILIGEGDREQIVIEGAAGNCVRVTGGPCVLRGLTLSGVALTQGKRFHAVSVSAGKLTLDNCIVSSDTLACVAVQGESTEAVIRNCFIHSGTTDGVLFTKGAKGTIERCQVTGHERHGLHIKDAAAPVVKECSFTGNRGYGVAAYAGFGTLQHCEIQKNHKTGVHIGNDAKLEISSCTITQNKQQGISAERHAAGIVTHCDLRQNVFGAWALASGSALQRNNNKEL